MINHRMFTPEDYGGLQGAAKHGIESYRAFSAVGAGLSSANKMYAFMENTAHPGQNPVGASAETRGSGKFFGTAGYRPPGG